MRLDREKKIIQCKYPLNGKEQSEVSNYGHALTVQKAVKKNCRKQEVYNNESKKALEAKAVVCVSDEDIAKHGDNLQHYVTYFAVENPESSTI